MPGPLPHDAPEHVGAILARMGWTAPPPPPRVWSAGQRDAARAAEHEAGDRALREAFARLTGRALY